MAGQVTCEEHEDVAKGRDPGEGFSAGDETQKDGDEKGVASVASL